MLIGYVSVSTNDQNTDLQRNALNCAGCERIFEDKISGTKSDRPGLKKLLRTLSAGDTLVVWKLDRLGRDNIDVQQTIAMLVDKGIDVVSLDLPVRNLASAEGKLMLQMFSAFAEFEKSRIIERTREGLARAKTEGKKLGRPAAVDTVKRVQEAKAKGLSQSKTALELGLSLPTSVTGTSKKRNLPKLFLLSL